MTSTRLRETIPTSLRIHLTQEAQQKGLRVSQLLTQILMERYKFKSVVVADVGMNSATLGDQYALADVVFEDE